ncbi:uncharacterized protein LOC115288529 [Suricata suricatta]|uniref:uncharacterized protein LOC115288529 n=1 Tax=Suricata suricatta TaxID=37032 RepID=UPI001155C62F|nr:uncharacterized protein LOC115288529 [Suricata suricatta]
MGHLLGQVGEEGPCAQHHDPEDGQADPGGQWVVPGSILLHRGIENDQEFHLSVYELVSRPQILAENLSLTPDWCNVTLECHPTGTTGAVNVSWESKGLPRELEQTGAPGPAPTPWTLALHLPLSRPSPSVTCVVSNLVDQKSATRDLGEVCVHGAGSQKKHRTLYGGVSHAGLVSRDGRDKGLKEPHVGQETPLTTVYTEVCSPGQVVSKT